MDITKETLAAEVTGEHTLVRFLTTSIRETTDVQKVCKELDEVLKGFSPSLVVLNFSRVNMVCSSFLGKLIALAAELKEQKAKVRACCLKEDILHAFKMLRLTKFIKVYATEEKALR